MIRKLAILTVLGGITLAGTGCATHTGEGTLLGGATGALIGGAIGSAHGNFGSGAAIGAAIGALTGGLVGDQMDREDQMARGEVHRVYSPPPRIVYRYEGYYCPPPPPPPPPVYYRYEYREVHRYYP